MASSSVQRRALASPGAEARSAAAVDSWEGSASAAPPVNAAPNITVITAVRDFERMD